MQGAYAAAKSPPMRSAPRVLSKLKGSVGGEDEDIAVQEVQRERQSKLEGCINLSTLLEWSKARNKPCQLQCNFDQRPPGVEKSFECNRIAENLLATLP